jgi:RNA polymerase sigma factor (sigma-70 family)
MPIFQGEPALLDAFRRGERWALERVYRSHVRTVDRYLGALAHAAHTPELIQPDSIADLLQEVFVRAFSRGARAAYDSERPYGPYLRRIAKNLLIDQLRARGRSVEESFELLPDSDSIPSDYGEHADPHVNAVLASYLAGLPSELREVYEQRFILGNSQETACAALGVTRRRLRTNEARLLSGLRRALFHNGIMRGDVTAPVRFALTLNTDAAM